MKKHLFLILLVGTFLFSGCCTTEQPQWNEYRLFFGRAIAGGGEVSNEAWQAFYEQEILPAFPDGITVADAIGAWKGKSGESIREQSKIVLIVSPASENIRPRLNAIRKKYREQFNQESVLLLEQTVHADF